MNGELSFRVIFATLWIVFIFISLSRKPREFSRRSIREALKTTSKWESKLDIATHIVLFLFWIAALILYVIYPDWMTYYTIPLPTWLRWAAIGAAIFPLSLLAWAHHALREEFSTQLQLRERHTLVTNGPYRWMRHPIYAAEFMFMISVAAESANSLVAPAMGLGIIFLYGRVKKEEAMMIDRFGDEYRNYMKRTGRFLPRLKISGAKKLGE